MVTLKVAGVGGKVATDLYVSLHRIKAATLKLQHYKEFVARVAGPLRYPDEHKDDLFQTVEEAAYKEFKVSLLAAGLY